MRKISAVIDASLMPLLAWLVEHRQYAAYSTVYSLSQTSVSLAYGLGPFLGGWLMGLIKFNRFFFQSLLAHKMRIQMTVVSFVLASFGYLRLQISSSVLLPSC